MILAKTVVDLFRSRGREGKRYQKGAGLNLASSRSIRLSYKGG
jgi:hypothetical protein